MRSRTPRPPDYSRKIIQGVVIVGGSFLIYTLGKKVIETLKQRSTTLQADQSQEVRQAMALRSAMNPSGTSWLRWADGTNLTAINQITAEITNLDSVIKAYRNLYGEDLITELQSELSTLDFNAFLQSISNNRINNVTGNQTTSTSSTGTYTKPLNLIVAKQTVYVRTSPDASNHAAWYEVASSSNIYKTAKAGEFIGYATGRQKYDAVNNVKFIEVAWRKSNTTKVLWVSASTLYVDQFTTIAAMEAKYPSTKGITKIYQTINGLGVLENQRNRAITMSATPLYDRNFNLKSQVQANVLLGEPMMTINGKGVNYTMVKTMQGLERWVESKNIRIS